ncbi:MAG: carbon-nitrogen hydrolase family protein [Syntrophomonadaceae bacterium]
MGRILNLAICQMQVTDSKTQNLIHAEAMIKQAALKGAQIVVLPEIFNLPYDTAIMAEQAESCPGETTALLAQSARRNHVTLVGGSIPELADNSKIFNTCFVFDQSGQQIGRYRKIHLFDIDIPGHVSFQESSVFTAGNRLEVIHHPDLSIGVVICYDIRFPELARLLALKGAQILVVPASFNLTTGPAHWELLMRTRAVDNQLYVVAASPARNPEAGYKSWGHSLVADPWGTVLVQAGSGEEILYCQLDLSVIGRVRGELPLLQHRRTDLYDVCEKGDIR